MLHSKRIIGSYSITPDKLNFTINKLVDSLLPYIINHTIIDGGNFQIIDKKPKTHYLATATFEAASHLHAEAKSQGKAVTQTFLIDNFSRPRFKLPDSYIKILNQCKIDPADEEQFTYFYETTLRNRANRTFRKWAKGIWGDSIMEPEKKITVLFNNEHTLATIHPDRKTSQFGRMILAQKLLDHEKTGYKLAVNFMAESSYMVKDGTNADVYYDLQGKMPVINIYFRENGNKINISITRHERKKFLATDLLSSYRLE